MCVQKISTDFRYVSDFISILNKVINKAAVHSGCEKVGGRFTLLLKKKGYPPLLETKIGTLSESDNLIFQEKSLKNAEWLQNNPEYFTSYDGQFDQINFHPAILANSNVMLNGGAISSNNYIFSFHGLSELWNEAVMLVVACHNKQLEEEDILLRISNQRNPYLRPFLKFCS